MSRLLLIFATVFAIALGGYAIATAQEEPEPAEGGGCATPSASPMAGMDMDATPEADATPDGTPEACPDGTPGAGGASDAVEVTIKDFAYDPDPVTIPVGGSITWTNEDNVPHTSTAQDKEILQSGALNQGDTYTQAFDTAGSYEYFCEFHANMKGTIIVE